MGPLSVSTAESQTLPTRPALGRYGRGPAASPTCSGSAHARVSDGEVEGERRYPPGNVQPQHGPELDAAVWIARVEQPSEPCIEVRAVAGMRLVRGTVVMVVAVKSKVQAERARGFLNVGDASTHRQQERLATGWGRTQRQVQASAISLGRAEQTRAEGTSLKPSPGPVGKPVLALGTRLVGKETETRISAPRGRDAAKNSRGLRASVPLSQTPIATRQISCLAIRPPAHAPGQCTTVCKTRHTQAREPFAPGTLPMQ
jgi:hypothetical protein